MPLIIEIGVSYESFAIYDLHVSLLPCSTLNMVSLCPLWKLWSLLKVPHRHTQVLHKVIDSLLKGKVVLH